MKVLRIMLLTTVVQIIVGLWFFYSVASLPDIKSTQLFNIVGLFLNICGVLMLSNLVIRVSEKRKYISDYIYAFFWAATLNIPLGVILGSISLFWLNLPSSGIVLSFASGIFVYIALPLFFTDYVGEIFKLGFYKSVTKRIVFMGWYLLLAGMTLQLVGSIVDLIS